MADKNDYQTPKWPIELIKPRVNELMSMVQGQSYILEPSCGQGNLIYAFPQYNFVGVEVADEWWDKLLKRDLGNLHYSYHTDFLARPATRAWHHLCLMNPPYNQAREFITKARQEARFVMAFLKLQFFESKDRHDWIKQNMPKEVHVIPDRVSSTGDGASDSLTRAWFLWDDVQRTSSELFMLPLTPLAIRKAG